LPAVARKDLEKYPGKEKSKSVNNDPEHAPIKRQEKKKATSSKKKKKGRGKKPKGKKTGFAQSPSRKKKPLGGKSRT